MFDDESHSPAPRDLAAALGRSAALWDELRASLADRFGPLTETWKFYKHWTLQVRHRKRTIVWLAPRAKHFLASTAYGEKAARAARESELPDATKASIVEAPQYAEGRAVRLEIRYRRDLATLLDVLAIKMAH